MVFGELGQELIQLWVMFQGRFPLVPPAFGWHACDGPGWGSNRVGMGLSSTPGIAGTAHVERVEGHSVPSPV